MRFSSITPMFYLACVFFGYGNLQSSLPRESILSQNTQKKLNTESELFKPRFFNPYKGFMSESKCRRLIHEAGLPTFPRPEDIPKSYRVKLSEKPGGIKYVHPKDEGTYVRIMPGKMHSKNPCQQKPYVNQRIHGKSLDKQGNTASNKSAKSHIPLGEFIYREAGNNL